MANNEKLNPRERAALEEAKKMRKSRAKYIVVGVIVALLIVAVIVINSSLFTNSFAAMKVGDTKYTVADGNYAYQAAYMNFYQQYGSYMSYLVDTSKPLSEQECLFDANGGSWRDYFLGLAEQNLLETTAYYNEAVKQGYTLTEDDLAEIDAMIDSYKSFASQNGYSLNGYLAAYFGEGNDEKNIRKNLKREMIVDAFIDDLYDSFTFTDAEIDARYTEHEDEYDLVNYSYVVFAAAADEENGITLDAAMAEAEQSAKAVLTEMDGDDLAAFTLSAAAASESGASETNSTVASFMERYGEAVTKEELTEGTVFTAEEGSAWYAIYVKGTDDNDYTLRNVRHILVKAVDEDEDGVYSDAEKQAALTAIEAIRDEFLAGDQTEESFAALANEKSEDEGSNTNGGLYENIVKGQMVPEFNDFCFEDHQSGDLGIVYGESSAYAGYHLIYFVSEGENYRSQIAENDLVNESFTNACTALTEPYTAEKTGMWRYVMKGM